LDEPSFPVFVVLQSSKNNPNNPVNPACPAVPGEIHASDSGTYFTGVAPADGTGAVQVQG